jgi:hypothetical protein
MTDRQLWLFPTLDLRSYIKRYPLVFLFSLAGAFSALLNTLAHLLMIQYVEIPIVGFNSVVRCMGLGVPLYGLLHLAQDSLNLKKSRSPLVLFALGLVLLFLLLQYFLDHSTIDLSAFTTHLYLFLILACLCLPLLRNAGDVGRQWAYLSGLVMSGAGALLLSWAASFFFRIVIEHISIPYFSYFLPEEGYNNPFGDNTLLFLILPWYLMGALGKFTKEKGPEPEPALGIGPVFLYSTMVLVLLGFFIDWMTMAYCAATWKLVEGDYTYGLTFTLLLAYFSYLLLIPARLQQMEKWILGYQRIVSWSAFPILLFTGLVLVKGERFGDWADFAFLYGLLGFAWVFAWSLARPRSGLAAPALGLLLMMGFSLAGPLSVRELSFHHYRGQLAKLFQAAGMLQGGKLVKPAAPLAKEDYILLDNDLAVIGSQFGITRLQDWFGFDLKVYENKEEQYQEGAWQNSTQLLQAMGVSECDVMVSNEPLNFRVKREGPLNIAGYDQEQRIYLGGNCPVAGPDNWDQYLLSFSNQNESLTVQYRGKFLADIPLQKIEQVLKAHDYSEIFRSKIPQEDLSVEYENGKVKMKVYFQTVLAFKYGDGYRVSGGSGVLLIKQK